MALDPVALAKDWAKPAWLGLKSVPCHCVDVGRDTLPETKLTGCAHLWVRKSLIEEGELHPLGVEFLVVAKCVANVGDVTCSPVSHSILGQAIVVGLLVRDYMLVLS